MSRRVRKRAFDEGSAGVFDAEEDINPNAYIVNLADCMLVLAVGFMVALVAAWNVDLPKLTEIRQQDMVEVEDAERVERDAVGDENAYERVGEVYQDPTTGKIYILEDTGEGEEEDEGK